MSVSITFIFLPRVLGFYNRNTYVLCVRLLWETQMINTATDVIIESPLIKICIYFVLAVNGFLLSSDIIYF